MLRIKAETRVLDCALPRSSMRPPCCTTSSEIHSLGDRVHELVEQVHDLGTRAL